MNDLAHPSLVLYGAGSQAYVLDSLARLIGYNVIAVLNDWEAPASFKVTAPLVIGEEAISVWLSEAVENSALSYAVSIGSYHGKARVEKHHFLRSKGLCPLSMIHPTAFISADAILGEACQVLAFGHVGTRCRLAAGVIINTRASVDHECILGDGVHIAPGAVLAGRVTVGDNTMICTGASVGPDVTIAPNCVIGAGSVVIKDIVEPGTYVGSPVRRVK